MATSLGRLRTAFRGISQKNYLKARNYSEQVVPKDLELAIAAHPGYGPGIKNDVRFWKTWGTYWGGLPFCFLFTFLTAFVWHEHLERAEFIPYDHLRRRPGKKLPFGDGNHNLLHNHKWVPLPDGYEFTEEEVGLKNPH